MNSYPSPRELADEALQAMCKMPMTPRERFEFLIQQGIIDRGGRVLVNKLFGPNARDESNGTPPRPDAPASKDSIPPVG